MLLDDLDYQAFPYVFATIPGWTGDMSGPIRDAARVALRHLVGTPFNLLEVGVWEARSGCWLLDNVLTHPGAQYIGVDAWVAFPSVPVSARKHLAYHGAKARLIEGDSKIEVPRLPREFLAAVVDGDHSYEGCYADLLNVWDKLLPGGILIADDYDYPRLPGVPQAVNRFLEERKAELTVLHKSVAIAFRKD